MTPYIFNLLVIVNFIGLGMPVLIIDMYMINKDISFKSNIINNIIGLSVYPALSFTLLGLADGVTVLI